MPDAARPDLPPSFGVGQADQRTMLTTFLDEHRAAAAATLDGLTDEEAHRSLVPSSTTVLGLVKHLTLVETIWFTELLLGTTRAELGLPATPAESFLLQDRDSVESVRHAHAEACARSRQAISGRALDEVITGHRFGPMTLGWILTHCIRETAQHVGHAEILREQILAARH